jgi:hypothetical protein
VKRWLEYKVLPFLPEDIENRLFMQGRKAWNFKYSDLNVKQNTKSKNVSFRIEATLKKEFREYREEHSFCFTATSVFSHEAQSWTVGKIKQVGGSILEEHNESE